MDGYQKKLQMHTERVAGLTAGLLRSGYGIWVLGLISFIESFLVVPIITDPFLVMYILANRRCVWRAVAVTTVTSLLGGFLAYVLAAVFFEFVAVHYLTGSTGELFYTVADGFKDNTFTFTLLGAITPVPYTIVALAVGFVEGNLAAFLVASLVGRGGRYILVGLLTKRFGEAAVGLARERVRTVTLFLLAAVFAYFLLKFFS